MVLRRKTEADPLIQHCKRIIDNLITAYKETLWKKIPDEVVFNRQKYGLASNH